MFRGDGDLDLDVSKVSFSGLFKAHHPLTLKSYRYSGLAGEEFGGFDQFQCSLPQNYSTKQNQTPSPLHFAQN